MVAFGNDPALRLDAMRARLGINDAWPKDGILLADMQRTCLHCLSHERCAAWLQSGRLDGYRSFCSNAEIIDWLRNSRSSLFAAAGR
jgi:hypothetical protein